MEPNRSSLDGNFPGNSNKEREERNSKTVNSVVTGPVRDRKLSPFMTFFVSMFGRTPKAIFQSFVREEVKPYTLQFIYNIGLGLWDEWLNGGQPPIQSSRTSQQIPIRTSLTSSASSSPQKEDRRKYVTDYTYNLAEKTYETKMDADRVIRSLFDYGYPWVPVSVYLSASGIEVEPADEDWGWHVDDLSNLKSRQAGHSWYIQGLPTPRRL